MSIKVRKFPDLSVKRIKLIALVLAFWLTLLSSCQKSSDYNALLLVSNNVTDIDSVQVLIELNDTKIFDGSVKKISHADQYSIFQFKMSKGRNSVKVTLPRFNVGDEISIDLKDRVALDVNLYYQPIKDPNVLSTVDSTFNKANVELRELKGRDFDKFYLLDHTLLKD